MKKIIIYSIYSFCLVLMIGLLVGYNFLNKSTKEELTKPVVDYDYVYDLFDNVTEYVNSNMVTNEHLELYGCVKVDEQFAKVLGLLMDKYTFEGVEFSWLKLCYYFKYLGPTSSN